MSAIILPLCADLITQIRCYIPPQSQTIPTLPSYRYTVYLPPRVLQGLQIKAGAWIPIQPFHTTLLNAQTPTSRSPVTFFSQQLAILAQVQPLLEPDFPPISTAIQTHLSFSHLAISPPPTTSQQHLPTIHNAPIFNTAEHLMNHLPLLDHPICVSPHLFSHLLLSLTLFNRMYPDATLDVQMGQRETVQTTPNFINRHFFVFSNLPISKHPTHPLHPSIMYQSAYMSAQFNQFSFLNAEQPLVTQNITNFGYLLNDSLLSLSISSNPPTSSSSSTFSFFSTSNKAQIPPKHPHDPHQSQTHQTIQFIPLFAVVNKLKPQVIQKAQQQADFEATKRDIVITPQTFTLNAIQYLFSLLYQRVISLIPSTKPSIVGHTTVGKQEKSSAKSASDKLTDSSNLHSDHHHCTFIPTSLQILMGKSLDEVQTQLRGQTRKSQTKPSSAVPPTQLPLMNSTSFISHLALHWSNHLNASFKGYLSHSTPLLYNILLPALSDHSTQRIQSLLVTGGVGSGKTLLSQQLSTIPFSTSFYYDLSNINILTFHHTLSTLLSQLQQRLTTPIDIPPSHLPHHFFPQPSTNTPPSTTTSQSPDQSTSQIPMFFEQIQQTITHIPLIHTIVFDNIDVLFNSTAGQEHLKKAKLEITQLLLSFLSTHISTPQQSPSPSAISLHPIILCVFTSRGGLFSESSQSTANPLASQREHSLQYNTVYQQLLSIMNFKLHFSPLTYAQRVEILSHYLNHTQLSFNPPGFLVQDSTSISSNSCDQEKPNEHNIAHNTGSDISTIGQNYTKCAHCSNLRYPPTSSLPLNQTSSKYHIYTKEAMIQEWAQTIHGVSPAVIQQLCSLAIIAAYKRHYPTSTSKRIDQEFTTQSLCISHQEWVYALELCKLYHAIPHQLIPQIYSSRRSTIPRQTPPASRILPIPTIHSSIHPIFRQYWGGYLSQLTQLMSVFTHKPSSQQQSPGLQLSKSYTNYNHLISAPSGMGKSRLIELLSYLLRLKMISVDVATLTSKYVGGSNALVNQLFVQARNNSPCILLFENIDTFIIRKTRKIPIQLFPSKKKSPNARTLAPNPSEDVDSVLTRLFTEGESVFDDLGGNDGFDPIHSKSNDTTIDHDQVPDTNTDSFHAPFPEDISDTETPNIQLKKQKHAKYESQPQVTRTKTFSYCNPILENILKQLDQISRQKQIQYDHHQQMMMSDSNAPDNSSTNSSINSNTAIHQLPQFLTDSLNAPLGLFSHPQIDFFSSSSSSSSSSTQSTHPTPPHTSTSPTNPSFCTPTVLPNHIDSVIVFATTHLPIAQISPTLITSTRFLHTLEFSPPSLIQRAQIFAQLLSTKPFVSREQFFEIHSAQSPQSLQSPHNVSVDVQYESQTFPLSALPTILHTPSDDSSALIREPCGSQSDDPFLLNLFPTYQHLTMFIALFSVQESEASSPSTGSTNANLSQVAKSSVSAATFAAIIDTSVLDALRDNIKFNNHDNRRDRAENTKLVPITPKNVLSGLRVICAYTGNLHEDIQIVNDHLDALKDLLNEEVSKRSDDISASSLLIQQQSTFSLPDFFEEFEYLVDR